MFFFYLQNQIFYLRKYNSFLVYCRELAPGTISLTGDRAQGDDSKHDLHYRHVSFLSYDVASGSEITPCNKIDKPLVVYRFTGNVMTSITTLRT